VKLSATLEIKVYVKKYLHVEWLYLSGASFNKSVTCYCYDGRDDLEIFQLPTILPSGDEGNAIVPLKKIT